MLKKASLSALCLAFVFMLSLVVVFGIQNRKIEAATCTVISRDLTIGSAGADVLSLQNFLISQGYTTVSATGNFDLNTQTAVKKFQAAYGIVSSGNPITTGYGELGTATRAKIQALSCGTSSATSTSTISTTTTQITISKIILTPALLRYGSTNSQVKLLQQLLNKDPETLVAKSGSGSPGHETTYFGSATRAAVVKFQNKYKSDVLTPAGLVKPTGIAGAFTVKKLIALNSVSGSVQVGINTCAPGDLFNALTGAPCNMSGVGTTTQPVNPVVNQNQNNSPITQLPIHNLPPPPIIVLPTASPVPTTPANPVPDITGSCSADVTAAHIGQAVHWTVTASGGTGAYDYSWLGTDGLAGTQNAQTMTYTTSGTKSASVTVVSAGKTSVIQCSNQVVIGLTGDINGDNRVDFSDLTLLSNDLNAKIGDPNYSAAVDLNNDGKIDFSDLLILAQNYTQILSVSCAASLATLPVNQQMTWTATAHGGTTTVSYSWSGTDNLSGSTPSVAMSYATAGQKIASVTVTSGNQTSSATCGPIAVQSLTPPPPPVTGPTFAIEWGGQTDTSLSSSLTHLVPAAWLKGADLSNTAQAVATVNSQTRPQGKKYLILSWEIFSNIDHDPVDMTDPVSGNQNSCVVDTDSGPDFRSCMWWDHGAAVDAQKLNTFFSQYLSSGGSLNGIVLDYEEGGMSESTFGAHDWNRSFSAGSNYYAIQHDSRFPATVEPQLAQVGFSTPSSLVGLVGSDINNCPWCNPDYWRFNQVANARMNHYFDIALSNVAWRYYPNIQISNYNTEYDSAQYPVPDIYGNAVYSGGNGSIMGNHQSPTYYGGFGGIQDVLGTGYAVTKFNAFRYAANSLRANKLSAPSVPLSPWVAAKNYQEPVPIAFNNTLNTSDYYQEMIFHFLLTGVDNLLYWNPHTSNQDALVDGVIIHPGDPFYATDASDKLLNDLLAQFDEVTGNDTSKTPLFINNNLGSWTSDYFLTGMQLSNGKKVWRYTPDLTTQGEGTVINTVTSQSRPVIVQTAKATITFPQADIYAPSTNLSGDGIWIIQDAGAAMPTVVAH